jgi:putative endonuclease
LSDRRVRLGRRGEGLAAARLQAQGYKIVERNWRCSAGEVDVVAERAGVWFFFEVRTRRGPEYGTPEESIGREKQERMGEVALSYVAEHDLADVDWRLGLVAIEVDRGGRLARLDIYESLW